MTTRCPKCRTGRLRQVSDFKGVLACWNCGRRVYPPDRMTSIPPDELARIREEARQEAHAERSARLAATREQKARQAGVLLMPGETFRKAARRLKMSESTLRRRVSRATSA